MRRAIRSLVVLALSGFFILVAGLPCRGGQLKLWYTKPAESWYEALPIGNGRLGAMVFGGTEQERIQFNEDTLWAGKPRSYAHPGAYRYLPKIRQLLFEGKQREAEQLAMQHFMSVPLRQMAYQPFGDVLLQFPGHHRVENYKRELDLNRAVVTVSYAVGKVQFSREIFASYPDQVIVMHFVADTPHALSFTAALRSPHQRWQVHCEDNSRLVLTGRPNDFNGTESVLTFCAHLVAQSDGQVNCRDNKLMVSNATEATLMLAAATSYRNWKDVSGNPDHDCRRVLTVAREKSYEQLLEAHLQDYRRLFSRVKLELHSSQEQPSLAALPTDERIKQFDGTNDPALLALYFQFGRYLLIASSRPGTQPANLQGIWNEDLRPAWESKWTVNINTEMNYWPAEVTNLPECHQPLFQLIKEVAESGRETARVHYNCRGWVLHHNTDIWRGTAPINNSNHGIWPTGGAWLCQHLWEHYLFTLDKEFLARDAYPVMKSAAEFFVDFLVEDPRTGWLISTPSNSPEHGGLVAGPTMDHEIIRDLFTWCIEAAEILDCDAEFRAKLRRLRQRIAPLEVGSWGQLKEWLDEKDDPHDHHRHLSHLYALYPSNQITLRETPELAKAARISLEARGPNDVGWSRAWQACLWARLEEPDLAYARLKELVARNSNPNLFNKCWDRRPRPFQIDGNFGGTAAIAEMLVQSHAGEIAILPAWPLNLLDTGKVTGLKARGNVTVNIRWREGELDTVVLQPTSDRVLKVRPPKDHAATACVCNGEPVDWHETPDGTVAIDCRANQSYELSFAKK